MTRCPSCDHSCKLVEGDGPEPCDVLFIGEKPGRMEANVGIPFIGDSGREFNDHYLRLAGLERSDIRITNTVKCRLGGNNNKPSDTQVSGCARHRLPEEVERCNPSLIVLMGSTACSLVPQLSLDKDHGIPVTIKQADHDNFFGEWSGPVCAMYHPASGLHDTAMMIPLMEDFERLGQFLRGKWKAPVPPASRDYRLIESKKDMLDTLEDSPYVDHYLPSDTENDGPHPWSVQWSTAPGNGFIIMADRSDLLVSFSRMVRGYFRGLSLHNSLHDLDVYDALKIKLRAFQDTMIQAYNLGLPQGLKVLSYRLLGIRMQSWEDLVMPPSKQLLRDWMVERLIEEMDAPVVTEKQLKTKVKVISKPNDKQRDLQRIISHAHKDTYDAFDKLKEAGFGGYPYPSIAHVPIKQAVYYGCQDADVTGQVALQLATKREELVATGGDWQIDEEDYDV